MALGEQLREARRKMNLTASQVAAATHVKVQLIEDMENENFERIAAPIYGKGFIKLYAEYVGLDPRPLIAEYRNLVGSPAQTASIIPEESAVQGAETAEQTGAEPARGRRHEEFDLFNETGDSEPVEELAPATVPTSEIRENTAAALEETETEDGRDSWIAVPVGWLREGQARMATVGTALLTKFQQMTAERDPWKLMPMSLGVLVMLVFLASGLSQCTRDVDSVGDASTPSESLRLAVDVPEPYFE